MNFKKWLNINEAGGTVRTRPTGAAVSDRSSLYGLSAQFGHRGTQLPLSAGFNNKAVAGLLAGVGSGASKAIANTGYEASPTPQIEKLPTLSKPHLEHGHLPLQLPVIISHIKDWLPGFEPNKMSSYESDIAKQVYKHVPDPENDPRVAKNVDNPNDGSKFATLRSMSPQEEKDLFGVAKNFTRALIKISIINRMKNQELDKKYDLSKGKLGKEYEEDGNLVCVFYFEPYRALDQEEVD